MTFQPHIAGLATRALIAVCVSAAAGDQVEVQGALGVGDVVVKRGSDEIRNGSSLPK